MMDIIRRKIIKETKPIQFKIYFTNANGVYVKVFIWKTKGDMYAGAGMENTKYHACYIPIIRSNTNCFGEVHFYGDFLGAGVVAHELLHVIFDVSYRVGKKEIKTPSPRENYKSPKSKYCESLCQEIEKLSKDFWNKFYNIRDKSKSRK